MRKSHLVYCKDPEQYDVFDERINKPVCFKKVENGIEVGSMVLQELDEIPFPKNPFNFFAPNNVGLLLSVSKRHADRAKIIYNTEINPSKGNRSVFDTQDDKKKFLQKQSILAADYIETIQIAVVFSYTAIETFTNLSIPHNYQYSNEIKNKGITEIYNKEAIERWLNLSDKIAKILTNVYKTKRIEQEPFWSNFKTLEKMRNDIIHQKSIKRTDFYKEYFVERIFKVINSASALLTFFHDSHIKDNKINPLWPWIIGKDRSFPVTTEYDKNDFEVIGNVFQGVRNPQDTKRK